MIQKNPKTKYRIIDSLTGETLANAIPDHTTAQQQLELLELEYPHIWLEIEPYTQNES